jgi:signal transduction histidine kinase
MADKKTIEEPEQKIKRLEKEIVKLNNMAKKLSTQLKSKKLAMQIQYEEELAMQLKYNTLKANIWKMAADKSLTENEVIQQILNIAGPILNVSRASFLRFNQVKKNVTAELQWCNEGISPTLGLSIPYSVFKHYSGNNYIKIDSRDTLSDLNQDAITLLKKYGAKSCLAAPYCENDNHKGFFTFTESVIDDRDWSESERYILFEIVKIVSARVNQIISDRKRRNLEEQLQQARKMEAIGALAGGIAHNFNNLLMGIQGNISLMLLDADLDQSHHQRLHKIEKVIQDAAELTRQILGFAEGGKYQVDLTDLTDLIQKSSEMFGGTRKQIKIYSKYQKDIWPVEVDKKQIEQVLFNLYVNAWEAMPGGGDLYLETENVILGEDHGKPYYVKPGNYVKLSVTDTGIGMTKKAQEMIFDPFFTTKEMGRGTGLGLAAAYGIIKNHDGIIDVYSEKGHGATFNIYLPASAEKVIKKEKSLAEVPGSTETILFVDDENMIIDVGEKMLKILGYNVLTARNGREAIEIYKKNRDKIDMVILDMVMPDTGGGETYDTLKKINPYIKVLLSSGYSIDGEATEIMERGCNGFIQKPFNMKGLAQKTREVLYEQLPLKH